MHAHVLENLRPPQDAKALEPAAAGASLPPAKAPRGVRRGRAPAPWSALDGLWAALGAAPELHAKRPAVLAAALHALLALCQVRQSMGIKLLGVGNSFHWGR